MCTEFGLILGLGLPAIHVAWEAVIVLAFWRFWRSGRPGGTSNLASDLAPIWRGRSGESLAVLATAPFWRPSRSDG